MLKLKAMPIVVGILIDTVGSVVAGVLYFVVVFAVSESAETPTFAIDVVGLLFTVVGGFTAARMARSEAVQHGAAVGVGAFVVWLCVEALSPADTLSSWHDLAVLLSVIPAGAVGGYIAERLGNKALSSA